METREVYLKFAHMFLSLIMENKLHQEECKQNLKDQWSLRRKISSPLNQFLF